MQEGSKPLRSALPAVTEANFGRQVLAEQLPVLLLFGASNCPASRALRPLLAEQAAAHTGLLRAATVNAERSSLLAEQFGVQATPTLIVVQHREVRTRVVGFVGPELLRLLCDQVAGGTLPPDP